MIGEPKPAGGRGGELADHHPSARPGHPAQLAQGISIALYTTGLGLIIAIPAMIFWRHFRALIDSFVIDMEQQAIKLVEVSHGERRA